MNSSKKLITKVITERKAPFIHHPVRSLPTGQLLQWSWAVEEAAFLLQPHDHVENSMGTRLKEVVSLLCTAISSLLFLKKIYLSIQTHVQCNRKIITQVCSASEEPGPEHTQIYPDFIWRHWRVPPELVYNRVFPRICRKAGDNDMHTSPVQEPFL